MLRYWKYCLKRFALHSQTPYTCLDRETCIILFIICWWSVMRFSDLLAKWLAKTLDYLWLLQLGRLTNNRGISVSGNREQTFFFCQIPVCLMLFSLEFKPIRLLFQPAHESRNGFIMEITIFWFQKGLTVVQSGMLLRLQPRRVSSSLLGNGKCYKWRIKPLWNALEVGIQSCINEEMYSIVLHLE